MTKFNPDNKTELTHGDCLHPAMKIKTKADARQYLKAYIAFIQTSLDKEPNPTGNTAEQIAKVNLGFFAGYYNAETMARVNRLFDTVHPILGTINPNKH